MTTFIRQIEKADIFCMTTHVCDRQLQREQQAEEQQGQKQATQMLVLSHEIVSKTT